MTIYIIEFNQDNNDKQSKSVEILKEEMAPLTQLVADFAENNPGSLTILDSAWLNKTIKIEARENILDKLKNDLPQIMRIEEPRKLQHG